MKCCFTNAVVCSVLGKCYHDTEAKFCLVPSRAWLLASIEYCVSFLLPCITAVNHVDELFKLRFDLINQGS